MTAIEDDIVLSAEQERTFAAIAEGRNVLVTGSAGTGKSTILKAMARQYGEQMQVCASTGIAAVNVGGMTVHSWAGLGLGNDSAPLIVATMRGRVLDRIRDNKILAIDEVSMIHSDLLDLVDRVFRIVRKNQHVPFGGMQLVMFGDFLQLPPVSKSPSKQKFAFQSPAWRDADIRVSLLTKVFRQADQHFAEVLNQVRVGQLTMDVRNTLKSRYRQDDPDPSILPVTVFTHNIDVDDFNEAKLDEIHEEEFEYESDDYGEPGPLIMLQKNCLAPDILRLKEGAQVMLLWNLDPRTGLANGSIGVVDDFTRHGQPMVRFANGMVIEITQREWSVKSGGRTLAVRRQLPLRLAWAITAHKSQGMTLDKIRVNLDRAFEFGQSYVALSRARTLEGLFIDSTKEGCIRAHPTAVKFYQECELI